jgi:hypothetical protein
LRPNYISNLRPIFDPRFLSCQCKHLRTL